MASEEDLQEDARRYSRNWAADARFCHVFNHTHECKPTCFKKTVYKKPSAGEPTQQLGACRFRFWRLVLIGQQWWRRMGKALVPQPTVAAADDADNEFGRCKVCRQNCFRGSTQDLCQVVLRCNVDYQYQHRTFPEEQQQQHGASEHKDAAPERAQKQKPQQALPGVLGWLVKRAGAAGAQGFQLLQSFAVAVRSSSVADFYATKYLAKPQQWLTSALGPLIAGFKKVEEEQKQAEERPTTYTASLRKLRTAIFAANRCVWISCCEACLFLCSDKSAVLSHRDAVVHGRKALFMMHECKRILNKQVVGEGLWQADLDRAQAHQDGNVLELHRATTDSERDDSVASEGAAEHSDAEAAGEDADAPDALSEHADGEAAPEDADMQEISAGSATVLGAD